MRDSPPSGNHEEWNRIWSANSEQVFTREDPKSVRQFWHRCYFEDLWRELGTAGSSTKCIELGAGRGTTSMYLASRGCDVTLVDLAPKAFDLARNGFARASLPAPRCVLADIADTGLEGHTFDCAYSIGVLEHFDDPLPILREACRLLKPGGLVFMVIVPAGSARTALLTRLLMTPWRPLLGPPVRWARNRFRGTPESVEMVRTAISDAMWEDWMRQLGAPGVRCIPYNPYPSVYRQAWAERLISLPLYRLHHSLKSAGDRPALAASPRFAFCQLLVGRVPNAPA